MTEWIPALDGIERRMETGGSVADVGCGHGASTIMMAQAYPHSAFVGIDYHDGSIEAARQSAAKAGVADRVRFQRGTAHDYAIPAGG